MRSRTINIPEGINTPRVIAIIVYDGCEILDVTAPVEAFEMANRALIERGITQPGYINILLAERAGFITTSSGLRLVADSWHDCTDKIDTLIVVGSPDGSLSMALANRALINWIKNTAPDLRRVVSICTGAFILAEAGLLDGRRATTHWMNTERLGRNYPSIQVEPDSIFVKDGPIATSAGATAGLDLALSLIEDDFGKKLALTVARRLVLYLKRPGGQTQFSTHLRAQMVTGGSLATVLTWLESNFHLKTTVETLAERACMSPRNFARTFLRETGTTPAKYIELIRLEQAIRLLEGTNQPIAVIAVECGYSSTEHLRRAFQKHMGISPNAYRERF
ncbi:MAG: GlxA family transcriptional regulator [Geobacteraceae bacterium]|nr:GlxA family transcriptional regulator [Geobacteraceae bacterium]